MHFFIGTRHGIQYHTLMVDILMPVLADVAKAGDLAYEKYRSDVKISLKEDQTPVTNVDQLIHEALCQSLAHFFPDVPVISEEGHIPSFKDRQKMDAYWALDPLDGTVDFIEETDHFVISLGYVSNHQPTMGILHHPVSGKSWVAIKNRGVFVQHHGGEIVPIQPPLPREEYVLLVSAHRNDEDLCKVVVRQREREFNKPVKVQPIGSALKLGYLAEGLGDEYIRFTPMKEWDFAAGHCLVNEAGFHATPLNPSDSIQYGTEDLCIPPISIRKTMTA